MYKNAMNPRPFWVNYTTRTKKINSQENEIRKKKIDEKLTSVYP